MLDPTVGRWTTTDPIGFTAEDTNLYRYVGNAPTNATDPTGLQEKGALERYWGSDRYLEDQERTRKKETARREAAARAAKGVPIDKTVKDISGPDVTVWVAQDIVKHIEYRRREQKRFRQEASDLRKQLLGLPGDAGRDAAIAADQSRKDAESFKYQAKYLMSAKWIDFGGPTSGKGMNTVRLAGKAIQKNQLGNIVLLVIGHLLPTAGGGDFTATYPYKNVPWTDRYDPSHPYASQYAEQFLEMQRADNLAAFGLGKSIANKIKELANWKATGVPTAKEVEGIIRQLFGDEAAMAAAVNEYKDLLEGSPTIHVDALFFVPRHGGFNTQSLQRDPRLEEYKGMSSIDYFTDVLKPAYRDHEKNPPEYARPMELDDWLLWNRENYMHPKGQHPVWSSVYWKK